MESHHRFGQIGGPNPGLVAPPHPILGALDLLDPDGGGPESSQPRGLLVRRAMAHGMNRDAYLNPGSNGIGTVATAPISSELPQHAGDIVLPNFDTAKANALLDAAGWNGPPAGGFRTSLNVPGLAERAFREEASEHLEVLAAGGEARTFGVSISQT